MLPITVAIADLEDGRRTAYERLLRADPSICVMADLAASRDTIGFVSRFEPRILLCAFELAVATNFSLLDAMRQECPATRVILLTDDAIQAAEIMQALAMGAHGYVRDEVLTAQLAAAVRCVDRGEAWVPRQMLGRMLLRYTSSVGRSE